MKDYNDIMSNWASVDDAHQYAKDVVDGNIVACKNILLACQRHFDDLKRTDWRWTFDEEAAQHFLNFMSLLEYPDGSVAGQPMKPHKWHTFLLVSIFGWVDKDDPDIRRFRDVYAMVGRKNSKSTVASAVALYEMFFAPDKSELYLVATNRDQAKIIFDKVISVYRRLPEEMKDALSNKYGKLVNTDNLVKLSPQSRDSKTQDGLSARLAIFDEAAAIVDRNSIEVITSSQGAQKSPLNLYITTAQPLSIGETLFREDLGYCQRLLNRDDKTDAEERTFALLYSLDSEEEWDQSHLFEKSNPSLPEMGKLMLEDLESKVSKAAAEPAQKGNFLVKSHNLFINSLDSWIDIREWNKNGVDDLDRTGECYVGVDLGLTSDLNAVSIVWLTPDAYHCEFKAFIPEEAFRNCATHVRGTYDRARASGSLITTPGNRIDLGVVEDYILGLLSQYNVQEVVFDPYKSQSMITSLENAGAPMVECRRGRVSMAPMVEETARVILDGRLKHLGDPFIAWQVSNTMADTDANDLTTIQKSEDYSLKIDNIVALSLAVGRATVHGGLDVAGTTIHVL